MPQNPDRDASHARSLGEIVRCSFGEAARVTANALGSPWAFIAACACVLGWAIAGPFFNYSEIWQLYINTGTTIATFLIVFLIQNTQNRDAKAIHLKLDELIRATHAARNRLINLENCTDDDLKEMQREFDRLRSRVDRDPAEDTPEHAANTARKARESAA